MKLQLDVLISNAGRSQRANWHKIDLKVDKELFDLNVFSLVHLNRIAVRYFLEAGGGHLVVNSSMSGKFAAPFSASYTGSKHAIQVTL
jgi:short-subunit dehydrogenase